MWDSAKNIEDKDAAILIKLAEELMKEDSLPLTDADPLPMLLLDGGGGRWPQEWVRWNGVKVRWGWCGPAGGQGGGGQLREWGLGREGVKVDLQWGQVAKRRKPCQELGDLEGCRPHYTYPPGPDPWDEWDSWRGGPPCGQLFVI